jgi:hypothetical protein
MGGNQSMTDEMTPTLYSLADAIEIDLIMGEHDFAGSRKAVLELFEGYSPTVISSIEESLYDDRNSVAAARIQIFGHLGLVVVAEYSTCRLTTFVIDRGKAKGKAFGKTWSRKNLYEWLEVCTKAVYHRNTYDTVWEKLDNGVGRLKEYNKQRDSGRTAREAHDEMWAR